MEKYAKKEKYNDLHSNLVIFKLSNSQQEFQLISYLHSNLVIFKSDHQTWQGKVYHVFTFQSGDIQMNSNKRCTL